MIVLNDFNVDDYDTDHVPTVSNNFLSEFAAVNGKIIKEIVTGKDRSLNISVETTYGLQKFPDYISTFTDGDLSVDETIEKLLSGGFEVSYVEGLPGNFIIKPYFGANKNKNLSDRTKITARGKNSNVSPIRKTWSGYYAGVSLTKEAKGIDFDLNLMYGNEDGLINQIAAVSLTKSFGASKKEAVKLEPVPDLPKVDESLTTQDYNKSFKELEIMRDLNKKLKAENAELKAQNEKLKLLAKQNLLAKQKEQENKAADNWSFWSEGTVSFGRIGDSRISSAKKIKTMAITIGADIKTANNKMFGMALSVGGDAIDFGNVKIALNLDTVSLTLYESLLFGKNRFIDTLIGLGTFKTDIVNAVGFSSTEAKRDGKQVFASFKIRETFKNDKLNFTPNAKIDLGFSTLSDYVEEGPANLKFNRQNIGTIITSIGGTLDNIIDLNGGTLKPFLQMDYYADISPSSEQKMSYKNDTTTTYKLVNIKGSTHNFKGKLGFDFMTDTGLSFTSSYQRTQNKGNGYSDGLYLEVSYMSPSKDTEYSMSLDNDKASLDYKKNINGFDITFGSNYSLMSEIPDYAVNIEVSNIF